MTRIRERVLTGLVMAILLLAVVHGKTVEGQSGTQGTDETVSGEGRIHGVFVGISDYGDRASSLSYTADDAVRARDALVRGAGMRAQDAVTLLDSDATVDALTDALERLAGRLGPEDTLVFFFSGHGARLDRTGGFDASDPDGIDETIELYDASVRDDELNDALNRIKAGTTVVVLDSCFSGGFAKDVISAPGRMGLFSSEEDVTSAVAGELRAGGYLAKFFELAIGDRAADADGDRLLTAFELSQYVRERYRSDVTTKAASDYVSIGSETSFQHVIIDRGSITPDTVLFTLTGTSAVRNEPVTRDSVEDMVLGEWPGLSTFGPDFGDDASRWALDGECDDPRFEGQGMAEYLVDGDIRHDATDCRTLFNRGRITLRSSW
jgi:hypothetical protein